MKHARFEDALRSYERDAIAVQNETLRQNAALQHVAMNGHLPG
jgi:hypothetical protein